MSEIHTETTDSSGTSKNLHPKSNNLFTRNSYWTSIAMRTSSFVAILVMFTIPKEYAFISAIVNIITSTLVMIKTVRGIPFYRTYINSLMFGVSCGCITSSCGTLLAFLVNNSDMGGDVFNYIGIGVSGLTILLTMLSLIVGFAGFEIYLRMIRKWLLKEIIKQIDVHKKYQKPEETTISDNFLHVNISGLKRSTDVQAAAMSDAGYNQFIQYLKDSPFKYKRPILLLFRLDLINEEVTIENGEEEIKLHDIVMRLGKGIIQRGYEDREMLESVAMMFAFCHHESQSYLSIAIELLVKSHRHSSIFTHGLSSIKIKEIQSLEEAAKSDGIVSPGYFKIQTIKKNQEMITALHKDFFKELLNDPIKISNLKSIMRKTSELCRTLLGLVMIATAIGFSAYHGIAIKSNIFNSSIVCIPQIISASVIKNIRSMQNWINIFVLSGYEWPTERNGYEMPSPSIYLRNFTDSIETSIFNIRELIALGQSLVFDVSTLTSYGKSMHSFKIPSVNGTDGFNTKQYIGEPEIRKVSVVEISNLLIQYMDKHMAQFPETDILNYFNSTSEATKVEIQQNLKNSTFMNPVKDYDFMLLWLNTPIASQAYKDFCIDFVELSSDSVASLQYQSQYFFLCVLVSYITFGLCTAIYIIVELRYIDRLIKLFEKEIGKDVIGKIYQKLSSKNDTETSLSTSILTKFARFDAFVVISILVISMIVPLIVGLIYYETSFNITTALVNYVDVKSSFECAQTMMLSSFYTTEMSIYFAIPSLSYSTKNLKYYGHPYFNSRSFSELSLEIKQQADTASANWNDLLYGDVNKTNDLPVLGSYPTVDNLLYGEKNCSLYLQQRNIPFSYDSFIEYCHGLENVVTEYLALTSEVTENTRDHYLTQSRNPNIIIDPLDIYLQHHDLFRMSLPLTKKLKSFVREFVDYASTLSTGYVIGANLFGLIFIAFLSFMIYTVMTNYWDTLQKVRIMLNYLPLDTIDRNDVLRNNVLYHSYPSIVEINVLNNSSKRSSNNTYLENLSEFINNHIEGTAVLNEKGEVEVINVSAHRMFGSKPADILGATFFKLVENSYLDKMKKTMSSLCEAAKKASEATTSEQSKLTDTIEVDCFRMNQTKFPAKLSFFTSNITGKGIMIVCTIKDITSEKKQNALLAEEKKNSENLLKNILPEGVAARLKKGETFIAEKLNDITCFFSDMVGFTKISSNMQATDLVKMLNYVVNGFDKLTEKYDLEKIKTIGDAYFVVGGLKGSSDHPESMLKFAIETFDVIKDFNTNGTLHNGEFLNIRVGINTGSCVAGVIGIKKFAYDLWGDTINTASRMESTGVPGRIQISRTTYERVYDLGFEFDERQVEVKGKGRMQAYLLNSKHHTNPDPSKSTPIGGDDADGEVVVQKLNQGQSMFIESTTMEEN
ncbi:predicted protein [Naegleria gruberi]|uniref:Predicted protein n=1 Tax=Naegleria gruberi TaxID=5762 RepID=D2VLV9_NAEGR|nr:uncharacterized protein NAEGRDRAFT_69917 [Naegleria gruberi]EFC42124.1 predicted protein [Naegleria gruberi]|eukprot:XP_002674868.1 predicted protein [Naegleria gruberi strain NEG-M]